MGPDPDALPEQFPLIDSIDQEILMHRDVHFGGLFPLMLEYYKEEKKGVQPEFDIARIERLAALQDQMKQNLALLFLSGSDAEKVGEALTAYKQLKAIYEVKNSRIKYPQLIADLILAEDEEAEAEIAAVVAEKDKIVQPLIDLLRKEELYDPLFPGYGQAPFLAVKCLERIGDKRAIISLFEALGKGDFFADEQILNALKAIGLPARDFLLKVIAGRPLNEDNERAAIALVVFKDDEQVADFCFDLLQQPDVEKDMCLSTYLVLICAGLKDPNKQQAFIEMSQNPYISSMLREDMKVVIRDWENNV